MSSRLRGLLVCAFVALALTMQAAGDCTLKTTPSYRPVINCPSPVVLTTDPGECSAYYNEDIPYLPNPIVGSGIDPTTRALRVQGEPISPQWSGCYCGTETSTGACYSTSSNDPSMVTSKNSDWRPNDDNSAWMSNAPISGGAGPEGFYRYTLTLDNKDTFIFSDTVIHQEGAADDVMLAFFCETDGVEGPRVPLPASSATDSTVNLEWPDITPSNCPGLEGPSTTKVHYELDNVLSTSSTHPTGLKVNLNGPVGLQATAVGYTDNCGRPLFDNSETLGSAQYPLGRTDNTVRIVDASENRAECSYYVTVEDGEPPVAQCNSLAVELDGSGLVMLPTSDFTAGSRDNCGVRDTTTSVSFFSCEDVGTTVVTALVEDGSGYSDTCSGEVTVLDRTPPVAVCQEITVLLNHDGIVHVNPATILESSIDNCAGYLTFEMEKTAFTCEDLGPNRVHAIVTDPSGNTGSCDATIHVRDPEPPTMVCNGIEIYLNEAGIAYVDVDRMIAGSSDNCGFANVTVVPEYFGCDALNDERTVDVVGIDLDGNSHSCTGYVGIKDEISPTAVCVQTYVALDQFGVGSVDALALASASTDNCGIDFGWTTSVYSCDDIGKGYLPANATVADFGGNIDTCTGSVEVLDGMGPVAVCTPGFAMVGADGRAYVDVNSLLSESWDNCGIVQWLASPMEFSCEHVGTQEIVGTVIDASGVAGNCTGQVQIFDDSPPDLECFPQTVTLDSYGIQVLEEGSFVIGTDNCLISRMEISQTLFHCEDIGEIPVTATGYDESQGSGTCTEIVTVVDDQPPTVVCNDVTVILDHEGLATISPEEVTSGSRDNCAITYREVIPNSFSCADLGEAVPINGVVFDATQGSGECSASAFVYDTSPPEVSCSDGTVDTGAEGFVIVTPSDMSALVYDNCGPGATAVAIGPTVYFTIADAGLVHSVTISATDASGNSGSATCNLFVTGTVFSGDHEQTVALFEPIDITWNDSPLRTDDDTVELFYSAMGVRKVIAQDVPFKDLVFHFSGFSGMPPNVDATVSMAINLQTAPDSLLFHIVMPSPV